MRAHYNIKRNQITNLSISKSKKVVLYYQSPFLSHVRTTYLTVLQKRRRKTEKWGSRNQVAMRNTEV